MANYKCGRCGQKLLRLADDCPTCLLKELKAKENAENPNTKTKID